MRKTAQIMGMPVSIDIPGLSDERLIEAAFEQFRRIDAQFSPFKNNSELYNFNRRRLTPSNVSIGMKAVMEACLAAEDETDGYFSARHSGEFDPSGYVKGWAISEVKDMFLEAGMRTFCIGAGGDIAAKSGGGKTWRIGILNPRDRKNVLARVVGKNISVATSGNYERGEHIINPKTGKPARDFLSLTVAGPDIIKADIYATAAYAMGMPGLDFIDKLLDYEVLAIDKNGKIYLSGGMANMLEGDLTITGKVI